MPGVIVANQPGVYLVDEDGNLITLADGASIGSAEGLIIAGKDGTSARFVRVAADGTLRIDPTGTTTQPISAASLPLPTGAATQATLATRASEATLASRLSKADFEARVNTQGQKAMAASTPVVVASDQSPLEVVPEPASTTAITSVAGSTSTVTVLAANTSRLGASVHNDSNKTMFLKLGAGASTSSFTVGVERDFYYEVPFGYTGILTAVWGSGVSGDARVTEFTA